MSLALNLKLGELKMATGADIVAKAATRIGDPYVLGSVVPLTNPNWHGPWDCAEFVSWAVFQASGIVYGWRPEDNPNTGESYTGYWAEDARRRGQIVSPTEAAAIPGAVLLRAPPSGHIVISDGNGGTIEARGAQWGVCRYVTAGRSWTHGILVPGITYARSAGPGAPLTTPAVFRLTQPAMHGPKVKEIQKAVTAAGYNPGPPDGLYGTQTYAAVRAFQQAEGLTVDGEVGPDTARALNVTL